MKNLPILYSFRRCPYAMRARSAIWVSNTAVEIREIDLKNKPDALLCIAPKATVPLLQLIDGSVISESLDIMNWALVQNDPQKWLGATTHLASYAALISKNDLVFKLQLDRYKYPDRFPKSEQEKARDQCEEFIKELEAILTVSSFLYANQLALADIAIFPFVRQFSMVEPYWFEARTYPKLKNWLKNLLSSNLFMSIMQRYPLWHPQNEPSYFCQNASG